MQEQLIRIGPHTIGAGQPPYIIAELSANHNGSLQRALDTIDAAKAAGASAVKIQTYTAETMTIDCDQPDFMINGGLWDGYKLFDLYKSAETPYEWHQPIFNHARKAGITVFSSPFDETAVDLLEDLNTPAYKIASFELTDLPLVRYVASTAKPLIMSTGMATEEEIAESVDAARTAGASQIILLHCVSSYPAPVEKTNLAQIPELAKRFSVISGLSDHTLGVTTSVAAVALGAHVIEKHFILNRSEKGPDSEFSIEPEELKQLCEAAESAALAVGKPTYQKSELELRNRSFRRSLYFVQSIKAGETISSDHVRRIRPGMGLSPKYYDSLIGKKVLRDVERGAAVSLDMLDDNEP